MIIGKDSFKKGAALFGLVLAGAIALVGVFYSRTIGIICSVLVAVAAWGAALKLYRRWKEK